MVVIKLVSFSWPLTFARSPKRPVLARRISIAVYAVTSFYFFIFFVISFLLQARDYDKARPRRERGRTGERKRNVPKSYDLPTDLIFVAFYRIDFAQNATRQLSLGTSSPGPEPVDADPSSSDHVGVKGEKSETNWVMFMTSSFLWKVGRIWEVH